MKFCLGRAVEWGSDPLPSPLVKDGREGKPKMGLLCVTYALKVALWATGRGLTLWRKLLTTCGSTRRVDPEDRTREG